MIRRSHPHPSSSLVEHCRSVSEGMFSVSKTILNRDYYKLASYCSSWMGWPHDILKDTEAFDKHLDRRNKCLLTRHSGGGALISYLIARFSLNNNPEILEGCALREFLPLLTFSVVAAHHSEIKKIKTKQEHKESLQEWLRSNNEASQVILDHAQSGQEKKMSLAQLKEEVEVFLEEDELFSEGEQADGFVLFSLLYLSRAFLGALTYADTISAVRQDKGILEPQNFEKYELVEKADFSNAQFKTFKNKSPLNELRDLFQENVVETLSTANRQYLHLLKAPTGLGKTIAVCKLLAKIHQEDGASRVYYLAPTTVILNQVEEEIKQYNSGSTLLFHYLEKNLSGSDEYSENPDERERKMHALDAGLVITTYHRMIQLLSGQDKKSCALLRGTKEATFVLDECQSLTYFQFTILANLFTVMSEYSKIRIIFMSATPQTEAVFMNALKMLKTSTTVTLKSLLSPSTSQTIHKSPFVNERRSIKVLENHDTIEKLAQVVREHRETQVDKSLLVLVNLAGDALKLAELLEPDYCITSNLRPVDLKSQLNLASEEIKEEPIFMIATSIIQAGVDLDFDAGFIELQELRNFRQGCGRVGRNYHEQRGTCPVYAFEFIEKNGKCRSSWFKQRFYDEEDNSDEAIKLEIEIIRNSIEIVKTYKGLLYDSDIEKIEKSFESQVFKIQESLSEKLIDWMSESYENQLNDNYDTGQGANFNEVIWYLTEPLKSDEGDEFIVLFTEQEQNIGLELIALMNDYEDSCKALHKLKDKSQFFAKLKLIKKQRADIRVFMAPYALRKWNILNSLKRNAQDLRSRHYEEFSCRILLNMPAEVYQGEGYGWQSKVDEGIEAASISI